MELTHPDKVLFPKEKITKADLLAYYKLVAPYLVSWVKGRALTIKRFPNGVTKQGFIQKNAPENLPTFVKILKIPKKTGGHIHHIDCRNLKTLEYLVQLGTISIHAPLSKASSIDKPDRLIFDLDPSGKDFNKVKQVALKLKKLLETELELKTHIMLTGSKGVHVVVFIKPLLDFEKVRSFAKDVASYIKEQNPKLVTLDISKTKRRGKVYIDVLRNAFAQTAVAPFSIRANSKASIAAFVSWNEFSKCKASDIYTVLNIKKYLLKNKNICSNLARSGCSLNSAIKRIKKLNET